MESTDLADSGLASAVARFPEAATVLQRLARSNPGFREVCEGYALAQQSLAGFEARLDAAERPEIDDYRTVIVELEGEINCFVREVGPDDLRRVRAKPGASGGAALLRHGGSLESGSSRGNLEHASRGLCRLRFLHRCPDVRDVTMPGDAIPGESGKATLRHALEPTGRASEILFGLIMVLTFTLSLSATAGGTADVRGVLLGALGCNLAWGIIDAVLYLFGIRGDRALGSASIRAIRAAEGDAAAHAIIARHLPPMVVDVLAPADLERIRVHLFALPEADLEVRLGKADYLGAACVFLLVTSCIVPVALPFLFIEDVVTALRISNAVALVLLFLTGFAFGRQTGRPWGVGFFMVGIGIVLVGIAIALGG